MKKWLQGVLDTLQIYFVYRLDVDTVTRSVAFLSTLGVMLFLYATGKPVPEPLIAFIGLLAGYYYRDMELRRRIRLISTRDKRKVN